MTVNYQPALLVRSQEELVNVQAPTINLLKGRKGGMTNRHLLCRYFRKLTSISYVASLESRVEKLERRIAYARSRKASVSMHDVDEPSEPPDRKDSLATIRAAIHGKAARRREAADVNELVSDFGFLSVHLKQSL